MLNATWQFYKSIEFEDYAFNSFHIHIFMNHLFGEIYSVANLKKQLSVTSNNERSDQADLSMWYGSCNDGFDEFSKCSSSAR